MSQRALHSRPPSNFNSCNFSMMNKRPKPIKLVQIAQRAILKDNYKEKLSEMASKGSKLAGKGLKSAYSASKTVSKGAYSASKTAYSASKTVAGKAKDMYDKNEIKTDTIKDKINRMRVTTKQVDADTGGTSGSTSENVKSSAFLGNKDDVRSLPGKVGFLGRFFSFFTRLFGKISAWFTGKLFQRLFNSKGAGGIFKKYKDQLVTKVMLFFGGLFSIYLVFKSTKGYVKNRKFRQKDREIDDLKTELKRMKDDLNKELDEFRQLNKSKKS